MFVIKDLVFWGYILLSCLAALASMTFAPALLPYIDFWWIPFAGMVIVKTLYQPFADWLETPLIEGEEEVKSNKEIERKFLVDLEKVRPLLKDGVHYEQGYMTDGFDPTIRVRVAGERGYITVKGKNEGAVRDEYEYEIPQMEAEAMLRKYCSSKLSKTRYVIPYMGHQFEVDCFKGSHALVIAEVEIEHEDEHVDLPDWITKEVTNDPQYYNSNLAKAQ